MTNTFALETYRHMYCFAYVGPISLNPDHDRVELDLGISSLRCNISNNRFVIYGFSTRTKNTFEMLCYSDLQGASITIPCSNIASKSAAIPSEKPSIVENSFAYHVAGISEYKSLVVKECLSTQGRVEYFGSCGQKNPSIL